MADILEENKIDLAAYMSDGIARLMAKAYKNVLSNPREAKFAFRMQQTFSKSEKRRKKVKEQEDLDVPTFLISSISTTCNLHCKGCYARSNGIANDAATDRNVVTMGLRGAMQSPLFRKIRDARALGWEHTGGCTLYEHREEISKLL